MPAVFTYCPVTITKDTIKAKDANGEKVIKSLGILAELVDVKSLEAIAAAVKENPNLIKTALSFL